MEDRIESFMVITTMTDGQKFSDVVSSRDIKGFIRELGEVYKDADIHNIRDIKIEWHV